MGIAPNGRKGLVFAFCAAMILAVPTPVRLHGQEADSGDPPVRIAIWDYEPFTGRTLPDFGLFTRRVVEVLEEAGIEHRIEFYPWLRIEKMMEDGEIWASFPYVPTPKRMETFDFVPIPGAWTVNYVFYARERDGASLPGDWDSLAGYRFGIVPGYWYVESLEDLGAELLVVPEEKDLPALLKAGRIDFAIMDANVVEWICRRDPRVSVSDFAVHGDARSTDLSEMAVSRTYPGTGRLVARFTEAGARMDLGNADMRGNHPWSDVDAQE